MSQFDRNDTYTKVVALIAQKLNVDKNTIVATKTLQELGADSLDLVEIIMKLEEQFGIEINDADAEKLVNIDDVVNYVHQRRTK
jgi:acyl carrier protein